MKEKELDKLLKAALERRVADVPPLPADFAERVLQKVEPRRRNKPRTIAFWVSSIAAALVVGFFLWPRQQTQQPEPVAPTVVAELPKQETDTPIEPEEPAPLNNQSTQIARNSLKTQNNQKNLNTQKAQSNQQNLSKPIVPEEPQPEPLLAEAEPVLPSSSGEGLGEGAVIPPEKQALVDIFLAEEVLQVAYAMQEQTEPLRAYISTLLGEEPETSHQIVLF